MKNHLLLAVMMLLPMVASADAVEINGIWYNLTDETKQAEVTEAPSNYGNYSGSVVIPEKITYGSDEYSVTSIGIRAFSGCSGLTSIIIPNSVTKIMHWAFENCSGLTSVTIPNTVTEISQGTFRNCSSLTSITIHNTVKKLDRVRSPVALA